MQNGFLEPKTMPLVDPTSLEKTRDLEAAFSGEKANLKGFKAVRRPTALVAEILRKSNNFFITGPRGLVEMGINPAEVHKVLHPTLDNGKPNPDFDPVKMMAFVPKVAEVVVLLTCDDEDLDSYDEDPKALKKATREVMKLHTSPEVLALLGDIQEEFNKINQSTAVADEEDQEFPSLEAKTKKKQTRLG